LRHPPSDLAPRRRGRTVRIPEIDAGGEVQPLLDALGETVELVVSVRVADGIDPGVDFVIEGPLQAWKGMLDNIHELGAADTEHSLNTLTHFGERLTVRYDDPDGHDKLYRFAESVQEWLDLSARVDFRYPDGTTPPPRREVARRVAQ
jgi:hypothetical protein